jgi:hypothetical protein
MGVEYIVKLALRALGVDTSKADERAVGARRTARRHRLQHKEGAVVKEHRDMLGGILDLRELELSDVMVHRTKMHTIDGGLPLNEIIEEVLKSGHTRIPVWTGDPGQHRRRAACQGPVRRPARRRRRYLQNRYRSHLVRRPGSSPTPPPSTTSSTPSCAARAISPSSSTSTARSWAW